MTIFITSFLAGLLLIVWSADKFIEGASGLAKHYHLPPLLIGIVIIGFGTSAPEMVVSISASFDGNSGIALGNAYGSNITNIALILGISALLKPISIQSLVLKKELPILTLVTLISIFLLRDFVLTKGDAFLLLFMFVGFVIWSIWESTKGKKDNLEKEINFELGELTPTIKKSFVFLILGLILLIISSRLLVYGAVGISTYLGIPNVVIGLTVVAVGTSLPELASSVIAARKGESDMAFGNILGSNLFNSLAVVGFSGLIHPITIDKSIYFRDLSTMLLLTLSLFIFGFRFKKQGSINRIEGGVLLGAYLFYTFYLFRQI